MQAILDILSEGNKRSLGRVDEVVETILNHPDQLNSLFECLFIEDEIVRMRASDSLEKICRQQPKLLDPYKSRLLNQVSTLRQPSVKWHLAQILGEIDLDSNEKTQAIQLLFSNLPDGNDWIVINYSLETLAKFAKENDGVRRRLLEILNKFQNSSYKSIATRSKRLLQQFD